MAKKKQVPSWPVSVEIDGKTYTGSYIVEGRTVTVTYDLRSQSTHASDGPNEHTARILLLELLSASTRLD